MSPAPDPARTDLAERSAVAPAVRAVVPRPVLGDLTISVVLPVLNEAEGLAATLPEIPAYVAEVIIVDGGSTDDTHATIRRHRPDATVLHQDGRGKGNALKAGVAVASGDIVVTMDADGSMDPADIGSAILRLLAGDDFVKGSRCLPGGGSSDFTAVRKAGNSFLTGVANALFGRRYTDITYGFNAYWQGTYGRVDDLADGFEFEIQLAVRAARSGLRTSEVACHEASRIGGASKLHAVRDGWRILRVLLLEARPRHEARLQPRAGAFLGDRAIVDRELVLDHDLHAVR